MRYLITGHTGFKGSWLALWLATEGHVVGGLALDPQRGGLFERADVAELLAADHRVDIRDGERVRAVVTAFAPDVVVHLAAQPLVHEGFRDPEGTFTTNVGGTLNVMAAMQATPAVRAGLIVTTDKVYRGCPPAGGFAEDAPLGGVDPYARSKTVADLLTQSWIASVPGPPVAIARAGNVVGGGDLAPGRLMPDLVRALRAGQSPHLRCPDAVRPWQHVLDCLSGYRALIAELLAGGVPAGTAWNFGPDLTQTWTVREIADRVSAAFGLAVEFEARPTGTPEAEVLLLDSRRAREALGWHARLAVDDMIGWTVDYERSDRNARDLVLEQIAAYEALA